MGFFEAIGSVFNNYFSFSGRALRSEYWYFGLFSWLVFILAVILDETLFYSSNTDFYGTVELAATVVLFIPSLAVTSRRLHDSGKSGWWQLIWLTIIGIPLLLYWLIRKGDPSKNRFGMPPYGSKSDNSSASRAAREVPSKPSTNNGSDSNPSAESQEKPNPTPSKPQNNERDKPSPRASSSPSTPPAKPKDLYFDNRRKPNKPSSSEQTSTSDEPKENKDSSQSSEDDVFFDNRLKKE